MSRQLKIAIFSAILLFSVYKKYSDDSWDNLIDNSSKKNTIENSLQKTETGEYFSFYNGDGSIYSKHQIQEMAKNIDITYDEYLTKYNLRDVSVEVLISSNKYFTPNTNNSDGRIYTKESIETTAYTLGITFDEYLTKYNLRDVSEKTRVSSNNDFTPNTNNKTQANPKFFLTPKNGFSPYNLCFGKGVYNNDTGNAFIIKNSNSTDAVVLLVNTYTNRKVRNEFIRKGETFKMTGVPHGTYYLEWMSGNDWSPELRVNNCLVGGFQTGQSFTKTRDRDDWMNVDGYKEWTVTLYTVTGGDVASESLSAGEFGN